MNNEMTTTNVQLRSGVSADAAAIHALITTNLTDVERDTLLETFGGA